jgi:hypothetical protein
MTLCFPNDSRPERTNIVLSVAKVNKRKGFWLVTRRRKVKPFTPVDFVADAIRVLRFREQAGKFHRMVMSRGKIRFQRLRFGGNGFCFFNEFGPGRRECNLSEPVSDFR